jgi:PEP-CTERM motif-containing protein
MKTESLLKRLSLVGAACAAMSLAPVGQAHVLGSTGLFGDTVTISYNSDSGVLAGAFTGATWDGVPIPNFWCIDLDHQVSLPFSYPAYTAAPFQSFPLTFTGTEVNNLQTLFSNNYSPALLFSSTDAAAAFQLAIWDILFDNDGMLSTPDPNTGGGSGPGSGFGLVSAPPGVATLAQAWIDAAEKGPQSPFSLTQLTNASVPPYQNFILPGGTPILLNAPEPTGLALLGAGLIAMMFVMRRRRADVHWAS